MKQVFLKDGKLVPEEETYKGGSWSWNEGIWYQYAQKHAYDHGTLASTAIQDASANEVVVELNH